MGLQPGNVYHGFRLIKEEFIKEINSTARLFYHDKSGARLFNLENDDDNKVFSISFRTPPEDNTGIPHILEHSVLCGSRKFPAKEPFVELVKGSLNTFLNAMTYPDKTMYPVASKNEKDFFNLMDVYLDAVFYPNIYKYPEILMQEGWHYELDHKDSPITYKGVVYNEMKGAFSSPESILYRKIGESILPDTIYALESGGDPDAIPELTLEKFLAFHKKYYHPSNSYIYLYGNGDILKQMEFIDNNYLKDFDAIKVDSEITPQKPFDKMRELEVEYPILKDEEEKDKTYFSLNFAVGKSTDRELYLALQILEYMLLETPAAPLKKALIDADIGKNVFGAFDNSILQPVFSVVVKNSNLDKKDRFKQVVFETLKDLSKKGIDKKLIEASINITEFQLREADTRGIPKGLFYGIKCMDSWLYGEDPGLHLAYESTLEKIKSALTTDYFERIIEKYILNNTHCSILTLKPKKGLGEEKEKEVMEKLAQYKSRLSEDEIQVIIDQTRKLRERQATPDSPEDLEKIPMLEVSDINPDAEKLPLVEKDEEGIKILHHPMFTNKIAYVNLIFDTSAVEQELLPYIGLLSDIYGKVSTAEHDYSDLSNEVNIHTGGIGFFVDALEKNGDCDEYYPKFIIKSKAIVDKLPKLIKLIGEIVETSKFDEEKRIKEIIQETKSKLEMKIFDRGHIVAGKRLSSYFSPAAYYMEILTGLTYYKFISTLEKNFSSKWEEIKANLKKTSELIFNKKGLIVSVTCEEEDYGEFQRALPGLLKNIKYVDSKEIKYQFDLSAHNEGLVTPGKVQYVAKGYNFVKLGHKYNGCMQVLRTIASYDYLWNRIRVQGGAYGAFNVFNRSGNMYFSSYRDPNLKETLRVYDEAGDFVRNFSADKREMTKYIIGTISRLDAPLTPSMKGEVAAEYYIRNITYEDVQRERQEVLNTGVEEIRMLSDLISECMKQNYYCVLGSEGKIKENKDIFNELVRVFE